jgi:hypothetical protein
MWYKVFVFEPAIPDAPRSLRDAGSQGQSLSKNVSRSQTKCLALLSPNVSRMMYRNAQGHGQTVGQDTDITYRSRHDYKWHA